MGYERDITCSKCGAVYKLFKIKIAMRDNDSEKCEICNNTLISWNGAVMYTTELISRGS